MRVLMLNNEFPPLGGGTGTVNQAILACFAGIAELEVDLVTSALGRRAETESFAERIRIIKVPVNNQNIHHSTNRELLTYAARALPTAVGLHRQRRYDICLAWSAVPAGGVALAMHRLTGLPYVVRVSGPDIPGFERRYGALYPMLTPVIRSVWHTAAVVVAKCTGEAELIGATDAKVGVTLIPNGVDLAAFQPAEISASGPLRLLCVARLIDRKGQHHLIAAVRRLVNEGLDVTLDLVGTGDAQAMCEALAQELDVADRVRFSGYVPREQIAEHYAQADVFVLPSFNEGMSVATLEAMAAGLPTIVTRTGGTAELVADQVSGLTFDWSDVKALTSHIARLARDRQLAQRMGAVARERATHFSWDAAAQRYLELFSELTHSHTTAQPAIPTVAVRK